MLIRNIGTMKKEFEEQLKDVKQQTEMAINEKEKAYNEVKEIKKLLYNDLLKIKQSQSIQNKKQSYTDTNFPIKNNNSNSFLDRENNNRINSLLMQKQLQNENKNISNYNNKINKPNSMSQNTIQLEANTNFIPLDKQGQHSNKAMLTLSMLNNDDINLKPSRFYNFNKESIENKSIKYDNNSGNLGDHLVHKDYQIEYTNQGKMNNLSKLNDSLLINDVLQKYDNLQTSKLLNNFELEEEAKNIDAFLVKYNL